jgi:hypothetical protein
METAAGYGLLSGLHGHIACYRLMRRLFYLRGHDPKGIQSEYEYDWTAQPRDFHTISKIVLGLELDMRMATNEQLHAMCGWLSGEIRKFDRSERARANEWYPDGWEVAMIDNEAKVEIK